MTDDTALREVDRITGELSLWVCEQIWQKSSPISLGRAGEFRPADDEELASLGYGENVTDVLVLVRESDGMFFEIELDAYIRRVQPKDGAP